MKTDNRVAFVTGGGRGIGKALALGFGREGYRVVVASTTRSRNQAVADLLRERGGEALPLEVDVSDEQAVNRAISTAVDRFGRIDVLINNAGLKGGFVPPDERKLTALSLPIWQRMLQVNVTGAFLCARECAIRMIAQRGGTIINITSGAGQSGTNGSYSISKAALNMMNKALALELQEHNISVNALAPGATDVRERDPSKPNSEPRPNMLRPETSLPVSLYLAAQDPIEVTGEIIDVLAWNEAHGFGGREVWSVRAPAQP